MNRESPKIAALLLAAGPSSRLGQAKQLVRFNEECLVRRVSRLLLEQDSMTVSVVVGAEHERVRKEIEDLPVTIVHNPEWEQGMGASISCGVRKITGDVDGFLLMVCDQWRLQGEDIAALVDAWKSDVSGILVASWHEGRAMVSGPPVIFPFKLRQELISVIRNRGARQVIDRHMDIARFVELENAAHDLDRPEDLEELLKPGSLYPSS